MTRLFRAAALALGLVALAGLLPAARAASETTTDITGCEQLASAALPRVTITRAQLVPAGRFAGTPAGILPDGQTGQRPYSLLPEFCRIAATLKPTDDSDIKIEVWMPAAGWNGKLEALGNGGWAGLISIQSLAVGLGRGYAVAMTDTGHSGNSGDASFAQGHPEKLTDFAYRAVHDMTVQAKALIAAYYGKNPDRAYWNGCSTGGRQGLKEAQKYPGDFDGIIAGAPANYMTHLMAHTMWVASVSHKDPANFIQAEKYPALHAAALAACDAADGVKDGVIDDPRKCQFDPADIICGPVNGPSCLTAAQVRTARAIYAPLTSPKTGTVIYPGLEPGSEMGWATGLAGSTPLTIGLTYARSVLFEDPRWDVTMFDPDRDVARAEALDHGDMDAIDPDLSAFVGRGGKLLMYHGWNDMLIAPRNSVNYYESVVKKLGADRIKDSVRLFMEPGVQHCAGGDGPSNFDALAVLEQWVEQHKAPERIVATHLTGGAVDRTRPLCVYPQVAAYNGTGSTDDAANFTCKIK